MNHITPFQTDLCDEYSLCYEIDDYSVFEIDSKFLSKERENYILQYKVAKNSDYKKII